MIILGLLLLLVGHPGAASQAGAGDESARPRWDLRTLHPEVRSRIHVHAADVPKFPHEIASLMNPRLWPKNVTLKGKRCVLHVEGAEYGRSALLPRSIAEIENYSPFTLYYTEAAAARESRVEVGPAYMWISPKQLAYRRFSETKGGYRVSYEYGYHEGGALYRYVVSRSRVGRTGQAGRRGASGFQNDRYMEFFDSDGSLIGASYTRLNADGSTVAAHYKEGKRVSYPPFTREQPVSGESPAEPGSSEAPISK